MMTAGYKKFILHATLFILLISVLTPIDCFAAINGSSFSCPQNTYITGGTRIDGTRLRNISTPPNTQNFPNVSTLILKPSNATDITIDGTVYTMARRTAYTLTGSFNVTFTDPDQLTLNSGSGSITPNPDQLPPAPIAANQTFEITIPEDTAQIDAYVLNDCTGEGILINQIVNNPNNGSAAIRGSRTYIRYTPDTGFFGTDSLTYNIKDSYNRISNNATLTLIVNGPPAPEAVNDTVNYVNSEDPGYIEVSVLLNDIGSGNTINTIQLTGGQGNIAKRNNSTVIRYTPPNSTYEGTVLISYNIKDAYNRISNNAILTINITAPPLPVPENDLAEMTVPAETSVQIPVLGNDIGAGITVNQITSNPTHGTVSIRNRNREIRYVREVGYTGEFSFTYNIIDEQNRVSTTDATVIVTVQAPELEAVDDNFGARVGRRSTLRVMTNDIQTDAEIISTTNPSHGTISINGDRIDYTPSSGYTGPDSFTYTIKSPYAEATSTATVSIYVSDVPVAVDDSVSITRENPSGADDAVTIDVRANDAPRKRDVSIEAITTAPDYGNAVISNDKIIYTPNNDFYNGVDTFQYTVTDGSEVSAPGTVTVTVFSPELPVANDDSGSLFLPGTQVDIIVLDNDTTYGSETVEVVTQPTKGSTQLRSNNTQIRYVRNSSFDSPGTDTFTYRIIDTVGRYSNTATVTITVADRPVAVNDTAEVQTGRSVDISVLANDIPSNATINTVPTLPEHGQIQLRNNNTEVRYTPDGGYTGPDSFTYTIIKDGVISANAATVSIYVGSPPLIVATDDTATVTSNSTVSIPVLENDSGALLSIHSITAPTAGTAVINGENIDYTSNTNYVGNDSFTYTIRDESGSEATATVTVTIEAEALNAPDDLTASTAFRTALTFDAVSQCTGTGVIITSVNTPTPSGSGSAVRDGDNIIYTPGSSFTGNATITFTIEDIAGTSDTGTLTITVSSPTAPTAPDIDGGTTEYETLITITVIPPSTGIDITIQSASSDSGLTTINGNDIEFTPSTGFSGIASISYTVVDAASQTASGTITITVNPPSGGEFSVTNDFATTTIVTSGETTSGLETTIDVLKNDTGTGLTVNSITQPSNGTASIVNDKVVYTYDPVNTPFSSYPGTDTFTYTAKNEQNQISSPATVTVEVIDQSTTSVEDVLSEVDTFTKSMAYMAAIEAKDFLESITSNNCTDATESPSVKYQLYSMVFNKFAENDSNINTVNSAFSNLASQRVNLDPDSQDFATERDNFLTQKAATISALESLINTYKDVTQ